jgi:four helix bundle protein
MPLRADPSTLLVHQVAVEIAAETVILVKAFRGAGAFERADQMAAAALSVASNIAEACGRCSVGEFRQFLGFARGSAQELATQLRVVRLLDTVDGAKVNRLHGRTILVLKMLTRLSAHPPPID